LSSEPNKGLRIRPPPRISSLAGRLERAYPLALEVDYFLEQSAERSIRMLEGARNLHHELQVNFYDGFKDVAIARMKDLINQATSGG